MKKIICCLVAAVLCFGLLCGTASASETETDWASYDWENFSIIGLEDSVWDDMCAWFRTEAEPSVLFFVLGRTDGFYATDMSGVLYDRFMADPEKILYALTQEEDSVWKNCASFIAYGADDSEALAAVLETVTLSGPDADKGYVILAELIAETEEEWNVDIVNPKTGDPVGIAVAAMTVCSFGSAALLGKKRMLT